MFNGPLKPDDRLALLKLLLPDVPFASGHPIHVTQAIADRLTVVRPPVPASASLEVTRVASIALSGQRAVRDDGGGAAEYCDARDLSHLHMLIGVTTGASGSGATATIQFGGDMTEGSWSWTPGAAIFCGNAGILTQTFDPVWAWSRVIAYAVTPTKIRILVREPVIL